MVSKTIATWVNDLYNTHDKTCVTSKDSDQPVHQPSMACVLVNPFLDSLKAVESTFDQHIWSDCTYAQADLSLWVAQVFLYSSIGNEGSDHPAHLRNLIRTFVVCLKEYWILYKIYLCWGFTAQSTQWGQSVQNNNYRNNPKYWDR